jgi:hypothetical protein
MIKYLLDTSGCLSREQHLNYPSSEYQQISIENLETVLEGLDHYPTPVGSIEFVRNYLEIVGRVEPAPLNYLRYIKGTEAQSFVSLASRYNVFSKYSVMNLFSYEKRNIWLTSYDSEIFRRLNEKQKLFIKPYKLKEFDPAVIDIGQQPSEEIQKSEKIFLSDVVDFSSEYRFYVCDKQILGYSIYGEGDPQYVDIRFVEYIISEFKHYTYTHGHPVAYSVDIGIDKNGEHYLVELNDGWSLGYYPWGTCSFGSYLRVINSRWDQILSGADTIWS